VAEALRETMITGIRNAHALEAQAVTLLEREIDRVGDYPALQARKRLHLEETRRQQDALERLLSERGASPSSLKETALQLWSNIQAVLNSVAQDEVLKATFASHGFEAYEVASYKALALMARRCGDGEVERVCQGILREEEAMLAWLNEHADEVVERWIEVQGYAVTPAAPSTDKPAPAGPAAASPGPEHGKSRGDPARVGDETGASSQAEAPTPRL
jgi:ferritin-like metal-binding protein YciE